MTIARVVVSLAFLACIARETWASDQWPMFQQNASHNGFMPVPLDPSRFHSLWDADLGGASLNPVTGADGLVFVTQRGYFGVQSLFTLNARNGSVRWSVDYEGVFSVNPPSYGFGNVYIQTCNNAGDTYLRSYRARDGRFRFRTLHGAQWERYSAPTIFDGAVYVDGGEYGGMYSFDAVSGSEGWYVGLPQYDGWTPAVDAGHTYAYLGEYAPGLYVFDRISGTPAYTIVDPNFRWDGWTMGPAPVLDGQGGAFTIHDGRLTKWDLKGQAIAWQLFSTFSGEPAVHGGVVYAIDAGTFAAYDRKTGERQWAVEIPNDNLGGNIVVTQTHAFVSGAKAVYCIDLDAKSSIWSWPSPGALAIAEGTLYIAGVDGVVHAIGLGVQDISVPVSFAEGRSRLGIPVTRSLTIRNFGDHPLQITSVTSSSTLFEVPTKGFTIAAHGQKAVPVTFTPAAVGKTGATLTVASDDPNESSVTTHLTGKGIAP
ncbi:MAG TPA: PQQ-binding-like beta-propeller repeat protein [Candidatus Binatia bacterium]|jgi:hypothetical protein